MNHLWRSEANLPDEFFGERVTICSHLMENSPTYCANGVVFGLTDSKCGNLSEQAVRGTERLFDGLGIAPGGDHLVPRRQGRFGDFCADPARGASNEPDFGIL